MPLTSIDGHAATVRWPTPTRSAKIRGDQRAVLRSSSMRRRCGYILRNLQLRTWPAPLTEITQSGSCRQLHLYGDSGIGNKPVNYVSWYRRGALHQLAAQRPGAARDTEDGSLHAQWAQRRHNHRRTWEPRSWIPSENEWYKAAYYDPAGDRSAYWLLSDAEQYVRQHHRRGDRRITMTADYVASPRTRHATSGSLWRWISSSYGTIRPRQATFGNGTDAVRSPARRAGCVGVPGTTTAASCASSIRTCNDPSYDGAIASGSVLPVSLNQRRVDPDDSSLSGADVDPPETLILLSIHTSPDVVTSHPDFRVQPPLTPPPGRESGSCKLANG